MSGGESVSNRCGAGLGWPERNLSAEETRGLWQWVSKKLAFGSPAYGQPANVGEFGPLVPERLVNLMPGRAAQ
jgi:hypothetical protein